MEDERSLAQRLGQTVHVSLLRRKVLGLQKLYPGLNPPCLEDWLLDLANHRGARSVSRSVDSLNAKWEAPSEEELSNTELVVAICQPQNRDRPQWFRVAAELISAGRVDVGELLFLVRKERCERILAELSKQALIAETENPIWSEIQDAFCDVAPLSDALIHWSRLTTKKAAGRRRVIYAMT